MIACIEGSMHMKFFDPSIARGLKDSDVKKNLRTLLKYLALVATIVVAYSILFHVIMYFVEGREFSWFSGIYWTLTVMSTLGFGDITFESDIGRLYSMIVLLTGIVLLLIVLPFAFLTYFYMPLLESRSKYRVARQVPAGIKDHVILCGFDAIARDLATRLKQEHIPYYVIEQDQEKALERHNKDIPVILGELDNEATYKAAKIQDAKLVLVNRSDTLNTKIILTIRHLVTDIPIVAIASEDESVHVLQLSGADHVLPVKRWLGEQLANRVNAQHAKSHPIGQYEDLLIAELPVHNTPLVSKTIRETDLRRDLGVSIVAIWKKGRLKPARSHERLTDDSVLVIIGSADQLQKVDDQFHDYDVNPNPVLVIGGGRVGAAAAQALSKKGIPVHIIERDPEIAQKVNAWCQRVFTGEASDYELLRTAGILEAPSVLLSTNDDTMNIYITSYCRQLNKDLRIVSRISDARNIDIIHRAGADFVLGYATLGSEAVLSISKGQELTVLGEGVTLFITPVPSALEGSSLAESGIGAKTGLSVIAIKVDGQVNTQLSANTLLPTGAEIVMLGNAEMRHSFNELFE